MSDIDIEEQVARLYGEPLDRFTAARNDLVSHLKKAGDKEAADRVRSLKKPSMSAWVVNQLVRTREVDLKRLLRAGEQVEKAQQSLLAGGKNADFDDARRKERAAVQAMRNAATEVHPEISVAILERVTRSLEAASSAEGRARLKEGRLTEDLEPPGFELLSGLGGGSQVKTAKSKQRLNTLSERRAAAREHLKTAQAETKKLEKEARKAEADAAKAVKAAESARKRSESAAAELTTIEDELAKVASKN